MVQKKLFFDLQAFLFFFIYLIDIVLSDKIQIDPNWFELKAYNALIVSILPDQITAYWQLDSQGYIQKQVNLTGCQCSTSTQDKSFVDQNVLYIFIYKTGNYYTAQFSDIVNALDKSSVNCQQQQGQANTRYFFYSGFYIITYQSQLIVRKNFVLINQMSSTDSNVIINKQIKKFSENDSKCIAYYDGNSSYIFWKGVEYLISTSTDYKYYLIDENSRLFFDGSQSIYQFQFDSTNQNLVKNIFILLDTGSIFSQLFTVPGYPNQVIVTYTKQQLQLFDTQTLKFLYSIGNSQIDISSTNNPFDLILTYQNIIIVGTNEYILTYQSNAFSSQNIQINNIYQLPCTDILYRRIFQSTKSQILFDQTNYYFITMDDLVCTPGQYMDSNNQTCSPCPQNCSKCLNTQQCQICITGFTVINNQCFQQIPNCKTQSSASQCSDCVSGYVLTNNQCFQQIANCKTQQSDTQCSDCVSGYVLINNQCFRQIDNCKTQTSESQCSECALGYVQINSQCIQQITNCKTQSTANQCSVCDSGYILSKEKTCQNDQCQEGQFLDSSQQCQSCSQNCQTCSSSTICLTCNQNYNLNSQKECISCEIDQFYDTISQKCTTCIKDMTNNGLCVAQCGANQYYDKVNQQCQKCSVQYQCKPSTPCSDQQYYDQSQMQCISCDKTCLTCQGPLSSDCKQCQKQYVLIEGKCIMSCEIGQYFDEGSQTCKICNGSNNSQCTYCQIGSFYDKGSKKCLNCDASCETCEGTGINQCTSCFQDAILTSGFCQYCLNGFYYDPKLLACVQCDKSCKTCKGGSKNDCLSCETNFNLNKNQCTIYQSDEQCQNITTYDENVFDDCFQGYQFAQISSICLQFLILSSILLSFLLICISPLSSPVSWCYLQIQQLIGNYIFSPYINTINWLDRYINWNYMIGALRLISNFIIFNFFLLLSSKSCLSVIDYSFFSAFAIIYSLFHFLLFSKLKSIDKYGQNSNLQLISLASVGTERIHFLQRIFWIGFEFRKLIISIIQGALMLSSNQYKSVPWIHFAFQIEKQQSNVNFNGNFSYAFDILDFNGNFYKQ
ncbi:surface protein (macronuclear) [Tetrahymena thermophila SB210]|uniref:Surface protein n=1 Tax=Tetrahymena thermophila (strain SB210) TaxID=312017 RepID=Q234U8_TETTS|nr:surface protein [Tetrahymena thermophila SB210]EAR91905.2 surface protein [Tetrahymena thermophila SB210]|eukprot:XP_001012150.2 surface protein [Tetrahymena thermophila SB210]